jgi:hypothetical protein
VSELKRKRNWQKKVRRLDRDWKSKKGPEYDGHPDVVVGEDNDY